MAKKKKHVCWCGKGYGTGLGLNQHRRKADHYKSDEQKREEAAIWGKQFEEMKRRTETYVGEATHSLKDGRHLKVGDRLRFEQIGTIKEITYVGVENQTVEVKVDLISKNYRHIKHEENGNS